MSALATLPLDVLELVERMLDPTRDRSYELTRLGPSVADYLAWKRTEDRAAERTLDQYERDLARLAVTLATRLPHEVTKDDVRRVRDTFPEGSRPRVTSVYRDFFGWLYEESDEPGFPWPIPRDPTRGIRNPRRARRLVYEIFTENEEARLFTHGPNREHGRAIEIRDRAMLYVLLRSGVRAEGARFLRVADVDLAEKWLIVGREKGGDGRVVPVSGPIIRALEEYMLTEIPRVRSGGELIERAPVPTDFLLYPAGSGKDGLLWTDPARACAYSTFWRWWHGCVTRAGVKYRKPHMTRHTYATKLRRSGADSDEVKKALGHRSLSSTEIYMHTDVRDVARAVDRLERTREIQEV